MLITTERSVSDVCYTNFMKIGIDGRFWNESGVGRYTRNLVSELQKIDKKNNYVLFASKENHIEIKSPNWKVIKSDIHWHSIEEQIKFPQIINRENLDLMHFPYFSVPVFYNRPYIVTIHDLILHHFATGEATTKSQIVYNLKLLGYKFIMKKSAQNARKIITVSNATKDEITEHLNVSQEKIVVIYEGVDHKIIRNSQFAIRNLNNYFLHVGNLYPHKNMNMVLESLKKIKDEDGLIIQLVIAGKEDFFHQKFQKRVKDLSLQNQIIFLGEVSDEKLGELYRNALALITPSLMEGFDLPAIEAMSNKCLILASDIPAHKEICKDAIIYFDLKNEEDLTSKIKDVYKNGKERYKEKIKKGKVLASQLSWEQMACKTLKIYENSTGL